jgi:drug/metabolite transporter superfamily protein YnfA
MKTFVLFALTAVAEILGCYLPFRWREGASAWLLFPAALSLAAFAWLLTLTPQQQVEPMQRTVASTSQLQCCGSRAWTAWDQRLGTGSE